MTTQATRTLQFLPEVFRTETNSQFLGSSLDLLTSQPEFKRVDGFIGNKYGYAVEANDTYVVEPTKERSDYQLSPSLTFLKPDTSTARDFIDYPGLLAALEKSNGVVDNPNKALSNEFYSWDSFADLNKLVNYSQYYWLPLGPDAIAITTPLTTDVVDIADIIGRPQYTSPNGVVFINGLKVVFESLTLPSSYQNKEYYVEGVGTSITLIPVGELIVSESTGGGIYNPWDASPWDTTGWSINLYIPMTPDYLLINRNSRDRNAWSRGNRWFSQAVIDTTIQFNGQVTTNENNIQTRAARPIIEFYGNLGLWNSGDISAGFVNFIDTTTLDPLSTIVGQPTCVINNGNPSIQITAQPGARVIFAAATDEDVRQTIYTVNYVPAGTGGSEVVTLTKVPGSVVVEGSQVYVISGPANTAGENLAGSAFRWSTTIGEYGHTIGWAQSQRKTLINQAPLFNIFNNSGTSIGGTGSTFEGTKLFSYEQGTGANDPVLGFPISYSSVSNLGDINFDVNLNSDTYTYNNGTTTVTAPISNGFVHYYPTYGTTEKRTGWVKAAAESVQYQVFTFPVTEDNQLAVTCDVLVSTSTWATTQVYLDGNFQDSDTYTVIPDASNNTTSISLNTLPQIGQEIAVLILSDQVSPTAYYTIPSNLQSNPFNTNITQISTGSIRNHYSTIFVNAPDLTGEQFGNNNYDDLGPLIQYGTSIIQSSASLALPMTFIRHPAYDITRALTYSSNEYIDYKNTIVDVAYREDYSVYQSPADILDNIVYKITSAKSPDESFFWSDMMPSGTPYRTNTYNIGAPVTSIICPLARVYDYSSANYYGVLVYLTRTVNKTVTYTQLVRGVDYVVSTDAPSLTVNYPLELDDVVTVREYNQTYGSYIPNTPTKLGLYQATRPRVITDTTYTQPTKFIVGHDGSYNKLYGNYTNGQLDDFRDIALLEFETRVYNNIKVSGAIPITAVDLLPGQFRTTTYTRDEIMPAYTECFLNWVGKNRVDYRTQVYNSGNQFTFNYNKSANKLDGSVLAQGYWRGLYRWFYDTTNPAGTPWEMLGFTDEPTWWAAQYGPAPYTSTNTMWLDLRDGLVRDPQGSYILPAYVRPRLLEVLPVDAAGTMLSPFDSVVGNFDPLTFKRGWIAGDEGPAESSYLKSSSWPFDLMKLMATFLPAKFYNLFADRDLYKYNADLDQYLFNGRYHLVPQELTIYGSGTAKNSYINWIVDYINQVGTDGATDVTTTLENIDVRLTYRLAGFSDKQYLKFLIERSTPTSNTPRLLIPDDSFDVLLYDNVAADTIVYSSVIVQKTRLGWTVWGNSLNNPYFDTVQPTPGPKEQITVNGTTIQLSTTYQPDSSVLVAYGTEFYSIQGVSEFMRNYGRRLAEQGVIDETLVSGVVVDWTKMITEFMSWASQGWEIGSTLSLNPNATEFGVLKPGLVVQPLTLQQDNFILNQNLLPLQPQNMAVIRDNEAFTVKVLSVGDAIAYSNLNLNAIEHAVVFNNTTTFNDTIYELTTGLRQNRLVLSGNKTANWTGYVNANGFILNEGDIQEWTPNGKYPKGQIVLYKSNYWSANQLNEPSQLFDYKTWTQVDYDTVKKGLLPNPSTDAYEATKFYDINQANLGIDQDLLAFGLIGFRPRQYMVDAELSDISQVNVYINMIKAKGTNRAAESFKGTTLSRNTIDYSIRENWAIKNGDFGGVGSSNFVEAMLSQALLTGNPSIVGFSSTGVTPTNANQVVPIADLINWGKAPTTANFLPPYNNDYTDERGLPTAGYVNLNDPKFTAYAYSDLNLDTDQVTTLFTSDYVWIANHRGSWDIVQPQSIGVTVESIANNLDGTINITFAGQHNLQENDLFFVAYFDEVVDGFFTVSTVVNLNTVTVESTLSKSTVTLDGQGVALKLVSRRFLQASDITNLPVTQFASRLAWVDSDTQGDWKVLAAGNNYLPQPELNTAEPSIGAAVAYTSNIGYIAADGLGNIFVNGLKVVDSSAGRNSLDGTVQLVASGNYVYASDPLGGRVLCYEMLSDSFAANGSTREFTPDDAIGSYGSFVVAIDDVVQSTGYSVDPATGKITFVTSPSQNSVVGVTYVSLLETITVANTGAIAVSSDRGWLYVADTRVPHIEVFMLDSTTDLYGLSADTLTGPAGEGWGTSIATSIDGSKLIVGAPLKSMMIGGTLEDNVGAAYIYSRGSQSFRMPATIDIDDASVNRALVYVNSVLDTGATITAGVVTLSSTPTAGSTVTVDWGTLTLQQALQSEAPHDEARFGNSVATNRYGAEMIVGVPYELNTDNSEGAVYRFTNAGQLYGTITCQPVLPVVSNITVFVDGYITVIPAGTSTAAAIATIINDAEPTNVIASAYGTTLVITTRADTSASDVPGDIIDLVGASTADLTALGITSYGTTASQIILNPDGGTNTAFGWTVAMNQETGLRNTVVVGARTGTTVSATTFDFKDNLDDDDTIFDNGATTFIDSFQNIGAVYQFDYLPSNTLSQDNPGKYVFGQYCNLPNSEDTTLAGISNSPRYGNAIAVNDGVIMIGSSTWYANGNGRVEAFKATAETSSWYTYRQQATAIDITQINNISLYDVITNTDLEYLDYIDPLQGKMLSAVETNIDFISSVDPASYTTGLVWGAEHIGRTWLDTTNLRMLNYNQGNADGTADNLYNSGNWGKAFPGSTADVLTWIGSTVAPINYNGAGYIVDINNYTTGQVLDRATETMVEHYYFWVKGYSEVPQGKSLSPNVVGQYILNPVNSGVAFMAALTTNAVALYNCGANIQSNSTAVHIGYGASSATNTVHQDWTLIQDGTYYDFLVGVPDSISGSPSGMYLKYINSFMGAEVVNGSLLSLPDTSLPELVRYGTQFRPRQTMFVDRQTALQNYIDYANAILIKYPITETRGMYLAQQAGATPVPYNVEEYWTPTNWWAEGYSDSTKIIIEVPTYTDLLTLGQAQLYTGTEGLFLGLETGLIAKVTANGQGLGETYVFNGIGWTRIGLENGTVQINQTLYTTTPAPSMEIYYIIRWLTEQVFTNDLEIENNRSLMLMFKLIQSQSLQQNNYLPWLNKTSLVDVVNVLRTLFPYKKFQRDNQELVAGYINEVKPFHVYIKQYTYLYKGSDTYAMDFTDFDLPAQFNAQLGTYISPQLVYGGTPMTGQYLPSSPIWNGVEYTKWFNNYGLTISNSEVQSVAVTKLVQNNLVTSIISSNVTTASTTITIASTAGIPPTGTVIVNTEVLTYVAVDYFLGILSLLETPNYAHPIGSEVTVLIPNLSASGFVIQVLNTDSLPDSGKIIIDAEVIGYTSVNRVTGILGGVTRGADNTVPAEHNYATSTVSIKTLPINIVSGGRGYTAQPTITAVIDSPATVPVWTSGTLYGVSDRVIYNNTGYYCIVDNADTSFDGLKWVETTIYPVPRVPATFTAKITGGSLSSITVNEAGNGYAVLPRFTVQPTGITASWSASDVDTVANQITIIGHPFETGDSVVFSGISTVGFPLLPGDYCYVGVIDSDTIALYQSPKDAADGGSTVPVSTIYHSATGDVDNPVFVTGSHVRLSLAGDFIDNFWVGLVDLTQPDLISLYNSLSDALNGVNSVLLPTADYVIANVQRTDNLRIKLIEQNSGTLTVTAIVSAYTNEQPVREMKIGIKFDRTSYSYDAADRNAIWRIQNEYKPTLNMPGFDLNDYDQLMTGTTYGGVNLLDPAFRYGQTYSFTFADIGVDTLTLTPARNITDPVDQVIFVATPNGFDQAFELMNRNSYWCRVVSATEVALYNSKNDADLDINRITYTAANDPSGGMLVTGQYDSVATGKNIGSRPYTITGGNFTDGYGPEEMVPAVITDTVNITVTSKPGSTWSPTAPATGLPSSAVQAHTGFSMTRFTATPATLTLKDGTTVANAISFAGRSPNPVSFAMYHSSGRIRVSKDDFAVQWIDEYITTSITGPIDVVIYEFGNGSQLIRSNSSIYAMTPANNPVPHTEILLDVPYAYVTLPSAGPDNYWLTAQVYANGQKLEYDVDYNIQPQRTLDPTNDPYNPAKIVFAGLYEPTNANNPLSDYISFVISQDVDGFAGGETFTANFNNGVLIVESLPVISLSVGTRIKYIDSGISTTTQIVSVIDSTSYIVSNSGLTLSSRIMTSVISGISIPETQWFNGLGPYTLDGFLGDDNADNIIVEIDGVRLGSTAPATVDFIIIKDMNSYPAPVYGLSDFDLNNLTVTVGGVPITQGVDWAPNVFDKPPYIVTGFDATFIVNGQPGNPLTTGYFDSGVPFDSNTYVAVTLSGAFMSNPANIGKRIVISYDPSPTVLPSFQVDVSTGVLTINNPMLPTQQVAVTTFNRTTQQSLVTQSLTDVTVSRITKVTGASGQPVIVTTADYHNLETGDRVTINAISPLTVPEINGGKYYVSVVSPKEFLLYRDADLTIPMSVSFTGSPPTPNCFVQVIRIKEFVVAGASQNQNPLQIEQPYQLSDTNRLWVSLNDDTPTDTAGEYISPSYLKIDYDPVAGENTLIILQQVDPSDDVIITSMVSSASPQETRFRINLDKFSGINEVFSNPLSVGNTIELAISSAGGPVSVFAGKNAITDFTQSRTKSLLTLTFPSSAIASSVTKVIVFPSPVEVYRENQPSRTYLSQDFDTTFQPSDQLIVADPYRVVTVSKYQKTISSIVIGSTSVNYVDIFGTTSAEITSIEVTHTGTRITDFDVLVINNNTIRLTFVTTPLAVGDVVDVTLAVGNVLMIAGEQIKFSSIDMATGVISGLRRGMDGTIVNMELPAGTKVQSVLATNLLSNSYYMEDWYNDGADTIPLQYSDTLPANFLNTTV